jgi:putative aldouronate transport system substrate-binding protein
MFRKIVSLFLLLSLALTVLSAHADVTPDGQLPIVDEPTELTVWASIPGGMDDYTNNATTKWVEAKTGVHINWIEVANAEATSKFNTSIAGGDYPDIYCKGGSGAELMQYAEDGVIFPLNDLIDKYGFYLKQRLAERPDVLETITAPDGNIYSLPRISYNLYGASPSKLWVYSEWLQRYMDETGSEKPRTPEELEKMLLFFKENDMNGNGDPNDEIPMTGQYNYGWDGGNPVYYLLNAFTYTPVCQSTKFFFANEDNQITSNVMTDEMREGLRYANRLYEEGLIAEETFVQDLVTFRSLTTTTKDKVIVATAGAPYPFRLLTAQPNVENAVAFTDYELLEPLQGADGKTVTFKTQIDTVGMMSLITTSCKHPEVAMRWLDYFYSDEMVQYLNYYGEEGVDWEWKEFPSLGGDNTAAVSNLNASQQAAIWNPDFVGNRWTTSEIYLKLPVNDVEASLRVSGGLLYDQYAVPVNLPTVIWCTDNDLVTEFSELGTLIGNYLITAINEFVLGIRDVDSDADWQEYTSALKNMGYDHYIELAQEYYFGK